MTLTVSLGTQYVTVPDLTNYVQADAEQQLKSLGVSVLVTQAVDTSVASGAVIRTDPAAGTQVESGSTVVVYVSRPQVATTTKVPSLSGMSVDDARTLLVQNHLGLGSQTDQYSDQPVGTVIGQNPAAGSTAKLNGRVNITVSAGRSPRRWSRKHPAAAAATGGAACGAVTAAPLPALLPAPRPVNPLPAAKAPALPTGGLRCWADGGRHERLYRKRHRRLLLR